MKKSSNIVGWCIRSMYLLLTIYIWGIKKWIVGIDSNMPTNYLIILGAICLGISVSIINPINYENKKLSIRNWNLSIVKLISLLLLALYTAFALVGSRVLFEFSFKGIIIMILVAVYVFPLLVLSIWGLQYLKEKKNKVKEFDKYFVWKCFLLLVVIWGIIYAGVWPGSLSFDSNLEIDQALGNVSFNTWQPYIHGMVLRAMLKLGGHICFFFLIQIISCAGPLAAFFNFLHKKGADKKKLYIIAGGFALCPGVYTMIVVLWRDTPFAVGMAWIMFLLIIYKENNSRLYYIQLLCALLTIVMTRSNGIIPYLFAVIYLGILGIKKNKKLLLVSCISAVLMCIINGPFAEAAGVEKTGTGMSVIAHPIVDAFMSIKYYGGRLPERAEMLMEDITIEEDGIWHRGYNENTFVTNYDHRKLENPIEWLELYFECFIKNPYIVIRNRLNKCDLLWDIFQPNFSNNMRRYIGIDQTYNNVYYSQTDNALTPIIKWGYSMSVTFGWDFLLYRSGIYIVLIGIALIYSDKNRKRYLISLIPFLGGVISLLYAMGYQDSRFVWWIGICFGILLMYELFGEEKNYVY